MSGVKDAWERLNVRYSALQRREQGLVAAAVVLAPLAIGYALLVDPQAIKSKVLEQGIARQSASSVELQGQVTVLQQQLQVDPDAGLKAELQALVGERDELDKQLQALSASLVRPENMNALLDGLLKRNAGLRLLSLKTLAPQSILTPVKAEGDKKPVERVFDLYRHGVEIRLEGRYTDLQAYLGQLEKLPQRLLWGSLNYRVVEHPRAEMTLVVYTLSPERAWLAL